MIIDCDACAVRDLECGDCVVTVLLGAPAASGTVTPGRAEVDLDGREQAAIAVLASSGLVPPLRLVSRDGGEADGGSAAAQLAASVTREDPGGPTAQDRHRAAG